MNSNPGLYRFFDLFNTIPTILQSLSDFAYWMFNTEFELGNFVATPIEFCFGAGLVLYATGTILKYLLKIVV